MWRIQWPDAAPGSSQSVRCPGDNDTSGLGLAHRTCMVGGVWGSVDASDCESVAIREIRIQVGGCCTHGKDISCLNTEHNHTSSIIVFKN